MHKFTVFQSVFSSIVGQIITCAKKLFVRVVAGIDLNVFSRAIFCILCRIRSLCHDKFFWGFYPTKKNLLKATRSRAFIYSLQ